MSRNLYDGLLHPDAQVSRNGFDLSHRKLFTAKAGELLPVLCEDMLPGDYFEIDTATLLRSMPLNTAAFLRCKMVFDFFFVPKTAIWSRWNDFINQRKDPRSSYQRNSLYEPNITIGKIVTDTKAEASPSYESVVNGSGARQKIAQLLGYGQYYGSRSDTSDTRSLTALPIYGYNFIYDHWYRNPWNDEPTDADIQKSNADLLQCSTYANSLVDTLFQGDTKFINMHYRGWNKDLFMGSLPNQQFGNVSSVNTSTSFDLDISTVTGYDYNRWSKTNGNVLDRNVSVLTDDNPSARTFSDGTDLIQHSHLLSLSQEDIPVSTSFDVIALRRALALQKWKEYNMRAGYRGSAQQRAQFGVSLPEDKRHELDFIDSYETSVMIDEVLSQSTNGATESNPNGNLGEIGGKGIAFGNGKKIKYSANQHGYLYCIFSIVPYSEYDAVGIDKSLVRSTPFDHFYPAFENQGLQPIQAYQLNDGVSSATRDNVIGYAPYAYEYKTRTDKVYGELAYVASRGEGGSTIAGTLNAWASHRVDLYYYNTLLGRLTKQNFYIVPSVLDTIFVQAADYQQSSDQFIIDMNFDFKAVRPMSVLGLPQF